MMTMMMDSARLEIDSDKHLCISIPETNSKKYDDINNNYYSKDKEIFDCHQTMKSNVLSSDKHENDTTLLTTTTMTTTVEVKVKTMKTSSRKRKLELDNQNNNDDHQINKQAPIAKNKKKVRMVNGDDDDDDNDDDEQQQKNKKKKKQTIDQSSGTDESAFGSCEPGTNVVLEGIVWNETDKGVLVVNITWRGKTYVGALLNTTEQNWAPPRYKSDIRSTKTNPNREHQLTFIPPIHDSSERILRNGKRRGSSTTVTPSSTTKTRSFKLPNTPLPSKIDETSTTTNEKILISSSNNLQDEEETGDNDSSRSVSPTTSGVSTTSSSPPLSNTNESQSTTTTTTTTITPAATTTIPIDLSNCKLTTISNESNLKTDDSLIPYHFPNEILFPSSFKKLSSNSSPVPSSSSSFLPMSSQLYFNSLTTAHYPTLSSLSKSSH